MKLDSLLSFASLLHRFQRVTRTAMTPPEKERWENSVEHSYQVVMLAWYVASTNKLDLDLDKVIKYALIHDLVEAYARDTYFADHEGQTTKEVREREAQERIAREFPEFEDLHACLAAYESKADAEATFVYALDKLVDPINNSLNDWEPARRKGMTLEKTIDIKKDKVARHPLVAEYFNDWIAFTKKQGLGDV